MEIVNRLQKIFNGHKICETLSNPTRTAILKYLIKEWPEVRTINEIEEILLKPVSATTISFYLKKLSEAGLITTDGHKRVFRASQRVIYVESSNDGFQVGEE